MALTKTSFAGMVKLAYSAVALPIATPSPAQRSKALPFGAVWGEYCRRHNVPENQGWLDRVREYEAREFPKRKA